MMTGNLGHDMPCYLVIRQYGNTGPGRGMLQAAQIHATGNISYITIRDRNDSVPESPSPSYESL